MKDSIPLFPLGQLLATSGVLEALTSSDIQIALSRHLQGDWGDLDTGDIEANNDALKNDSRLFSAYTGENGARFWVITEWDRSATTVLLPSEYRKQLPLTDMYPLSPPVAVFPLGMIAATASALAALTKFEIAAGLARHAKGDWGDLRKKARAANDRAIKNGSRLSSSYVTKSGCRFWITTEADRSETTVFLPKDSESAKRPPNRASLRPMEPSRFERDSINPEAACGSNPMATDNGSEQLELFPPDSVQPAELPRRSLYPQEWKVVSLRECPSPESLVLIDDPLKAVEYWHRHIATTPHYNSDVECVAVLVLTTRLRIKGHYLVSVGSLNESMAHPREVFRIAILAAAHAIVLMHNHPSGDSSPSASDAALTRRVREAGELLRIELCDHIIVGHQRYFSFKESGIV